MEHCNTENKDGCCDNLHSKDEKTKNLKGGEFKMMIKKKTLLWVVIGVLFLAVLFLTLKVNSISVSQLGATAQTASATSAMVGGC